MRRLPSIVTAREASMHLADRLKRTAQAFRHAYHEDLKLPLDQRR